VGRNEQSVDAMPAGNICGVTGIDQVLSKSGTIASDPDFAPFRSMTFSVAPVVKVAVTVKNPADLGKLSQGLKHLRQHDQLVQVTQEENGEWVIAGAGQLHLEILLKDLQELFLSGVKLVVKEPVVSLRETVVDESSQVVVAKSPNKLNRLYVESEPLAVQVVQGIEKDDIKCAPNDKEFITKMTQLGVEKAVAKRIWTFGCAPDATPNMVVDQTKGLSHMNEIKDLVCQGFIQATSKGVLCGERLRGLHVKLMDAKIHSDSAHRGAAQIIPAATQAFHGAQLASKPRLMEPIYLVDISVPTAEQQGVFETLQVNRAEVVEVNTGLMMGVKAHLPVLQSFGFADALRGKTAGKAFTQMSFSHWEVLPGDPLVEGNLAYEQLLHVRKRKGMKLEVPVLADYHDRV